MKFGIIGPGRIGGSLALQALENGNRLSAITGTSRESATSRK